jgi:aldehyde dehydrogenase (NAD+)
VAAARLAFDEGPWRKTSGRERGQMLYRLADLIDKNVDELATLEALDNGKTFNTAKNVDFHLVARQIRYDAGWADKCFGTIVPIDGPFMQYVRKEPLGVCA